MKKVLLTFEGTNFSEGAFLFARWMNTLQPLMVVGLFLPQTEYANLWSYASPIKVRPETLFIPLLEQEDAAVVTNHIKRFESLCQKNGIKYRVQKDFYDFALPELKKETRFADILVVSGELFYKSIVHSDPIDYLTDAAHTAECAVLIVPEKFSNPDTTILAYDGSEASVYAIKQFAYLFPELTKNKTLLVYLGEEAKDIPSQELLTELLSQHFPDVTFIQLEHGSKKSFREWVSSQKNTLLVSGSFGRSAFSQFLHKSFVADIIEEHQTPLFIAHK